MSRTPRVVMPNYPHHLVHRGHNGQTVFSEDADKHYYLSNLIEWKERLGCRLYAFCLMPNHIHLIVDPGDSPYALGLLMKRVAGRHTRHINRVQDRSGTLWQGRYYSSPIDVDAYLLMCQKYVEMNPVRAKLVSHPGEYPWSSYRQKTGMDNLSFIDDDPLYKALGRTRKKRQKRYSSLMTKSLPTNEELFIRKAAARCQLTGDSRFATSVFEKTGQRVYSRGRGRPKNRSVPFLGVQ